MTDEPRKATDVLLGVESKMNELLDLARAQDLVIKILSNKLNDVISRLDKQQAAPQKIIVETVQTPSKSSNPPSFPSMPAGDPGRTIPVTAEMALPQSDTPQGFRRNSRPETYAPKTVPPMPVQPPQQAAKLGDEPPPPSKYPVQLPPNSTLRTQASAPPGRGPGSEVVTVPPEANQIPGNKKGRAGSVVAPSQPHGSPPMAGVDQAQGQIPVRQRCVDKNGKSIFLADVEVVDMTTAQPILKTRTNGAGTWMASLGIGNYRVTIRKRENVTKEKIEAVQDIQIDGSVPKLELPMLIIK
jgi:hypothetical protein